MSTQKTQGSTKLFYPGDDEKVHFKRAGKAPKPTKLRTGIAPGSIVIILAGRFKGRRVVVLKQLQSGMLLVSGPYKLNGVPLRRINQAYVMPTRTTVSLEGVDVSKVEDAYFIKRKTASVKKSDDSAFFKGEAELSEADKKAIQEKRAAQSVFDKALLANVQKVEHLKSYLTKRFSLRSGQYPHMMKF
jgi:large subunit ribosomal protein L6e